jgi:hypothetical protein
MNIVSFGLGGAPDDEERRRFNELIRRQQIPENEVPGVATGAQLLSGTGDAALHLGPIEVFSTGVRLPLVVLLRRSDVLGAAGHDAFQQIQEGLFLGVQLPDGRKVADSVPRWMHPGDRADDEPMLFANGGGGGARTFTFDWFLAPVPDPGDLLVVAALPGAGLPEGRAVVPAAAMAAARAAVVEVWPWEEDVQPAQPRRERPPAPEGGWFADA